MIGRVIMAGLGTPFVVAAVLVLASAVLGDGGFGERLPMVIGGIVFGGAGLFLWAPAFPAAVNRILESENRVVKAVRTHLPPLAMGGMILLMGLLPVLAAFGVIPTDDASWSAPRWIGAVAGGLFVVAGLFVLTKPTVDRLEPRLQKWILGLFPLLIVTGMAVIAAWIGFAPGPRVFEGGAVNGILGISWSSGSGFLGRAAFGASAVFLIVITVIGWWKYLRGRW